MKILICGGAGFIGHHVARQLMRDGHTVVVADIKSQEKACEFVHYHDYCNSYYSLDLSKLYSWVVLENNYGKFDRIFQFAADMGGAGYIFTGENDANVMHGSALINLHCAQFAVKWGSRVFYSSSACIYPSYNQTDPDNPNCREDSAYPALPDSEYGWEKLFSERMYKAFERNYGLEVRIARFHNIFGPEGAWNNGKEKAPAAVCRKVAMTKVHPKVEIWGDGLQTRSFLYIDDAVKGILTLMDSDCLEIVNLGSEEMISINDLALLVADIANRKIEIVNITKPGMPVGVRGRCSDNALVEKHLGWRPQHTLRQGLEKTYKWIDRLVWCEV